MESSKIQLYGVNSKERPIPNGKPRNLATISLEPFSTSSNGPMSAAKNVKLGSLLSKIEKETVDPTVARSTIAIKLQASLATEKQNKVLKPATWTRTSPSPNNIEKRLNLNSRLSDSLSNGLNGQNSSVLSGTFEGVLNTTYLQTLNLEKKLSPGLVKTKIEKVTVTQIEKPVFRLGKIIEINEDIVMGDVNEEEDDVIMVEINKKKPRTQSTFIPMTSSRKRKFEDNLTQEGRNIRPFKGKKKENIPPNKPLSAYKILSKRVALIMTVSYTENLLNDEESKASELANLVAKRQSIVVTIVNQISQSIGQQEVKTKDRLDVLINALDDANAKLRDGVLRFEAKVRVVNALRTALAQKRAQLSKLKVSTRSFRGMKSYQMNTLC